MKRWDCISKAALVTLGIGIIYEKGKKPDKCEVLQELIDCGKISAKQAKFTQKAWGCCHSWHSKDKCNRKK